MSLFDGLAGWISDAASAWKFWVVVAPWDVGVRVRLGRIARELAPGPHLRVPFLDQVVMVNTRLRVEKVGSATVQGEGAGRVKTRTGQVGFRVSSPIRSMMAYSVPADVLATLAQREMAAGTPEDTGLAKLRAEMAGNGVDVEFFFYSDEAEVLALRLINNTDTYFSSGSGASSAEPVSHY